MAHERCFCACHEYPGTYYAEPCGMCLHFNSKGRFPGTLRQGWEPDGLHAECRAREAELRKELARLRGEG